ncbi:putative casein kinase II subunit beta-4-like protein [Tritrichomonas foetus]|uniref:Casein kinase II subunit beta n=1 Tax=Tritrichomonas foetus TaxID=1144522 RepID=A0A1J4K380_9EUKA|nr:putative casein kinase II subunit beta-4-like protein [Tritrichomonas foetus]|eukprot:OHT04182.1 putative casein kinase II subunit beta-4-like protein [Tritrichomonas foetus]
MWQEINYGEAFAKKQIVPAKSILSYLDSNQKEFIESSDTNRDWVKNYCSASKSKWFAEIDDNYLRDERNYVNFEEKLKMIFISRFHKGGQNRNDKYNPDEEFQKFYKLAKYLIKTKDKETSDFDLSIEGKIYSLNEDDEKLLEDIAESLYGLLHARYILTDDGLIKMAKKFQRCDFGTCLRIGCKSSPVLPIGLSDEPLQYPVKIFCPLCHDVYNLPDDFSAVEKTDGAYFGRTFPSIFMLNFPQFCDEKGFIESRGPRISRLKDDIKNAQNKNSETGSNIKGDELKEFLIVKQNNKYEELKFQRRTVCLKRPE